MIHRLISIAIISLCANIAISAQNSSKKSTYEGYLFAYFEGSGKTYRHLGETLVCRQSGNS